MQPDDTKFTVTDSASQWTTVTDWSKIHSIDDKPVSASDVIKANMEVVVETPMKKLAVVPTEEDVLSEDFFTERINRCCIDVCLMVNSSPSCTHHHRRGCLCCQNIVLILCFLARCH